MTDNDGHGHLLPLVQALLDAGNGLRPHPQTAAAFRPSQGGYYCPMTGPLRFDAIRDLPRRAEVHFDEENDNIFCRHCWTIIYGGHYQPVRSRRRELPTQTDEPISAAGRRARSDGVFVPRGNDDDLDSGQ